jgi:hypothetical protein
VSSSNFATTVRSRLWLLLPVVGATWLAALDVGGSDVVTPTPSPSSSAAVSTRGKSNVLWSENFRNALAWRDPQEHATRVVGLVYSIQTEGGASFLRAHHDATSRRGPPAVHLGKAFDGLALRDVGLLKWRWRARIQPGIKDDAWEDMAAAIYVVIKTPTLLRKGRGFKFGWLARSGPSQTFQRGLLQVPLRSDPPSLEWRTEEVDVCALYRRTFGPCEDEQIIYIGVLTDADGSKSIASGDYADFEIVAAR